MELHGCPLKNHLELMLKNSMWWAGGGGGEDLEILSGFLRPQGAECIFCHCTRGACLEECP